jgi:hypothetical protein
MVSDVLDVILSDAFDQAFVAFTSMYFIVSLRLDSFFDSPTPKLRDFYHHNQYVSSQREPLKVAPVRVITPQSGERFTSEAISAPPPSPGAQRLLAASDHARTRY